MPKLPLAKAAMLVRKEVFAKTQCFNGTFDANCQRSAVPDLLLVLVNMILDSSFQKRNPSLTLEGSGVMKKK